MKRVGIFGGSFNPVHAGHLYLAGLARDAVGLDEVWFLPCRISPHKQDRSPSSGEERVEWLRLALDGREWAKVDGMELEREGVSYSYETVEILAARQAAVKWFWIMGGDQWRALPSWKCPERLAAMVEFVVLARDGLEIEKREGYRLHVVEGAHEASSTAIRRALEAGERGVKWLDPRVEAAMRGCL